jgi:23S rRNA pseudouridine1911/1915/1917 synthase
MDTPVTAEAESLQLDTPTPGIRLDKYLTQRFPKFSRSFLQKLVAQGYILVNGRRAKASQKLSGIEKVTVRLPPAHTQLSGEVIPLTIIYEDEDILVIDKPAGLVVHPAPGHPDHTLVNAILTHCPQIAQSGDLARPGIVHRLDKDTSGLMVIAKNNVAREYLIGQFKSRAVTKSYLVLVKGRLSPEKGIIEAPIGRDPYNRKRMAIVKGGREASTRYEVKEYLNSCTLVDVFPLTGRTHQIRVHFSAIGHPVIGDRIYGGKPACLHRQFIHAHRLGFRLPADKQYREFTSPLPADLEQALRILASDV